MFRAFPVIFSLSLAFISPVSGFNEEAAADLWSEGFGWFQNGRNLNDAGQAPLALGSYREALRQFERVAEEFPGFETRMVTYRIKALRREIGDLEGSLTPGDLEMAREYGEIIALIQRADEERYEAKRAQALQLTREARASLDRIVAARPEVLGPALQDQMAVLLRDIEWLERRGTVVPSAVRVVSRTVSVSGRRIFGTTEFVGSGDLPTVPGSIAEEKSLFP